MLSFLVDCIQLLAALIWLPKFLLDSIGKKRRAFLACFGFLLPKARSASDERICFLIYAVSVGETKAASALFKQLKSMYPKACFFVSTRTETGQSEAKVSLAGADGYFLLPWDFSWNAKKIMKRLRPNVLIVVESDLWFNLLKTARSSGADVALVSARISEKSHLRFSMFPCFSKKLFSTFSLVCAQNALFADRFVTLGVKKEQVFITGNLKWDVETPMLKAEEKKKLQEKLGIKEDSQVIVIGSTHEGEEELIIQELLPLLQEFLLKLIVVPRHPARFSEVSSLLKKQSIPHSVFSSMDKKEKKEAIILVDKMGLLSYLYQIADLAIVAGSFFPSLGGHNILEPIKQGTPVLFGPYISNQKDMVQSVLASGAGRQVKAHDLQKEGKSILSDKKALADLQEKGRLLIKQSENSAAKTAGHLHLLLNAKNEPKKFSS
jgi:3-deoxy-D-manno-octulosonic-acid transferase